MRMSPIAIALALTLFSAGSMATETFDQQIAVDQGGLDTTSMPVFNPDELNDFDRNMTAARKQALTGAIHDDRELQDLREMLNNSDLERRKDIELRRRVPMQPDEIRDLRRTLSEIERAENEPISGVDFRIRNVTYDPDSSQPLIIMVADGYAAQVEFYDASGQPWSIRKDGVVGDSESFSRRVLGEDRHISSFSLSSRYRQSNAAVVLEGLSSTIPVLLKGSDSVVDGRVSVTIPKLGPNAQIMPVFTHEMENVSPELVRLQTGDAPAGAKRLTVSGVNNAEAWFDGEHLFLSLPGRLLLPPAINSSVSPTGRYLYKTAPSTFVSVSVNGQRLSGTIEGMYQTEIRRQSTIFDQGDF